MQNHFRAILIAGPTASGKSALAIRLAKDLSGVVINADSMQVYSDLRVITARPDAQEVEQAPHSLYGTIDGATACSAVQWAEMAMVEIERAWDKGLMPILVGGTGMYFKALLDGMVSIPPIDAAIRKKVRAEIAETGSEAMHAKLKALDAKAYERIEPADGQRIARAMEVALSTGKALSQWQEEPHSGPLTKLDDAGQIAKLVIDIDREKLYERCGQRLDKMVEGGALKEIQSLLDRDLDMSLPIMKALGVPSLSAYLRDEVTLQEALEAAKTQTRQFAKRQLTWFRNQFSAWDRVNAQLSESDYRSLLYYLNKKGLD